MLDRIVNAASTAVVSAYEQRIGELALEKQIMQEKVALCGRPTLMKVFEPPEPPYLSRH